MSTPIYDYLLGKLRTTDGASGSLYRFKGVKPTYADLPTTGNVTGDVWRVEADSADYAWTDTGQWTKIGSWNNVDAALSLTSVNPVQNKVITAEVTQIETKLDTIETNAQVNKIEHIKINGSELPIDEDTKTASGAVMSSSPFPPSFITNSTTLAFCDSIADTETAVCGMTYLGALFANDMPFSGNAEVIARIMTADKVIVLEMFSTDTPTNHWYAMYYGGSMHTGDEVCPWQGIMSIKGDANRGYMPTEDYQAASKKYVDDSVAPKVNRTELATVALTGSYTDLIDKPTIPSIEGLATVEYVDSVAATKANISKYGDKYISVGAQAANAVGDFSMAFGYQTKATTTNALAFGSYTSATDANAYAIGYWLTTNNSFGVVLGKFNKVDKTKNLVLSVGNGTSSTARSNALELNDAGDMLVSGNITASGYLYEGASRVATQAYVQNAVSTKADLADLAPVATSGKYTDLTDKPDINNPTVTFTQGGVTRGSITLNQSNDAVIEFAAGGGGGAVNDVTVNGESVVVQGVAEVEVPTKTSQITNDSGYITAPPSDGKFYAYKDGQWIDITSYLNIPTGTVMMYGTVPFDDATYTVEQGINSITDAQIQAAKTVGTLKTSDPVALGKVLATTSSGVWILILIPADSSLQAYDCSLDVPVPFTTWDEEQGPNDYANGRSRTVSGIAYKMYGCYSAVSGAEHYIFIQ